MPTYEFSCDKCGHNFELFLSFSEEHPSKCPKCKKKSLNQVFDGNTIICVKGENTIGQLGESNWKKYGGKIKEDMAKKQEETDKKLPWWRSGEVKGLSKERKPIDVSKIKDVKKYIEKGEK